MQLSDGGLIHSATDLVSYLDCPHKVGLELARARGELARPPAGDDAALAAKHGLAHEHSYLQRLRTEGLSIAELPEVLSGGAPALEQAAADTVAAMADGPAVIFQATFFGDGWQGRADFLRRVERPSALGSFSYEAHDTKLARSTKVSALLQLGVYSLQLEVVQGVMPAQMHVVLGDGSVDSIGTADVVPYVRRMMRRYEAAVAEQDLLASYPVPVSHCAVCSWAPRCEQRRLDDDHLSGLPGVRGQQAHRLERAGISTVASLGSLGSPPTVAKMNPDTVANLHRLAALQVKARAAGDQLAELKPPVDGGLDAIPAPSPGDLFFDLEGDPYLGDSGREYLWGWCDDTGDNGYVAVWGHDEVGEQAAVETFIDLVNERLQTHPDLHIYHYAAYEISALKRLTATYATREAELDQLLRDEVFVDLYAIARRGLWVSTPSYSIKDLERFYRPSRETEVTSGMASVVAYEDWLDSRDQRLLNDIADYNRDDCVSTLELRDWLLEQRPVGESAVEASDEEVDPPGPPSDQERRRAALVDQLTATGDPSDRLLAGLLGFHQRETRPEWWAYFARLAMTELELIDDSEALSGLTAEGVVGETRQSVIYRLAFDPAQESKLTEGQTVADPATEGGYTIDALDLRRGTVDLKVSKKRDAPTCKALIPTVAVVNERLEDALMDLADSVAAGDSAFGAAKAILRRRLPASVGTVPGEVLVREDEPAGDAVVRLGATLESSYLPVQGPPGSGKSHAGAELIRRLVANGQKVGVVGNSHAVVNNLLGKLPEGAGIGAEVLKVAGPPSEVPSGVEFRVSNARTRGEILDAPGAIVAGGTAWLFAHPDLREAFDVLVVDEAGQLSLANTVAAGVSAKSIVLLGDPQQLDQPIQGAHPPGTAASALGHLLNGAATVAPERGVFLDRSWRMAPDLCQAVSELSYEGRLASHPRCAGQRLLGAGSGIRFVAVEHEDCSRRSESEAERISELVDQLLADRWVDDEGTERPMTADDILVIAPYNAQVRLLESVLGDRARVGTVDKFQGQEAAVAIYSLTASAGDLIPRGLEFQFSRNRLNVAISRAKCLSYVVGTEALLDSKPNNREQLALMSGLVQVASAGADRQDVDGGSAHPPVAGGTP